MEIFFLFNKEGYEDFVISILNIYGKSSLSLSFYQDLSYVGTIREAAYHHERLSGETVCDRYAHSRDMACLSTRKD